MKYNAATIDTVKLQVRNNTGGNITAIKVVKIVGDHANTELPLFSTKWIFDICLFSVFV